MTFLGLYNFCVVVKAKSCIYSESFVLRVFSAAWQKSRRAGSGISHRTLTNWVVFPGFSLHWAVTMTLPMAPSRHFGGREVQYTPPKFISPWWILNFTTLTVPWLQLRPSGSVFAAWFYLQYLSMLGFKLPNKGWICRTPRWEPMARGSASCLVEHSHWIYLFNCVPDQLECFSRAQKDLNWWVLHILKWIPESNLKWVSSQPATPDLDPAGITGTGNHEKSVLHKCWLLSTLLNLYIKIFSLIKIRDYIRWTNTNTVISWI